MKILSIFLILFVGMVAAYPQSGKGVLGQLVNEGIVKPVIIPGIADKAKEATGWDWFVEVVSNAANGIGKYQDIGIEPSAIFAGQEEIECKQKCEEYRRKGWDLYVNGCSGPAYNSRSYKRCSEVL